MRRNLFLRSMPYVLSLVVWAGASRESRADCNAARQQAAAYQSYINTHCRDPRLASVCAQMRQYIDQVNRVCRTNPPTTQPPTNPPNNSSYDRYYQQMLRQIEANRQAALNLLASLRPGPNGGYVIRYRKPPDFHGQPWGSKVYTYHVKAYEARRVVSMLTNNRNLLIGINPW